MMMAMAAARVVDFSIVIMTRRVQMRTCECPSLDYESNDLLEEDLRRLHSCRNTS